jgi:RNA binding exosome subunit
MSTGDILAIASLVITIATIIFMIGKNAQRLQVVEKDLNNLGNKVGKSLSDLDNRLDRQATFITRLDQKVLYLEERQFGNDTAARIRGE